MGKNEGVKVFHFAKFGRPETLMRKRINLYELWGELDMVLCRSIRPSETSCGINSSFHFDVIIGISQ